MGHDAAAQLVAEGVFTKAERNDLEGLAASGVARNTSKIAAAIASFESSADLESGSENKIPRLSSRDLSARIMTSRISSRPASTRRLVRAKTTEDAAVGEIEVLFKQAGRGGVADSPLKDELKLTFAAAG
jgi:hypothetical protein